MRPLDHAMDRDQPSIAAFDDQMWPINCAILVLAGFVAGIVLAHSDFDDARLLYNGAVHLGVVASLVLLAFVAAYALQGKVRRRLQLCVLLSLLVHLSASLGVYCYPVRLPIAADRGPVRERSDPADEDRVAPDYHWVQAEEPDLEQSFESPVETALREEAPQAARIEPAVAEPTMPVADVPRVPEFVEAPMASAMAGPAPPDRPAALAAIRPSGPPAGPAMSRQTVRSLDLPQAQGEMPAIHQTAPRDGLAPPALAAVADPAERDPARTPAPPDALRSDARGNPVRPGPEPGQALAAKTPRPQLPTAVLSRIGASPAGGGRQPEAIAAASTPVRARVGGVSLPSSVLPTAAEPALAPAARGGSPGSRLEASGATAVERSPMSRAPAGPIISAAGTQDLGIGSSLLLARAGVHGGKGAGRPAVVGLGGEAEGALRAGAPGSLVDFGPPLPMAAARRASASQPASGGTDLSPGVGATLPRTRTAAGSELPASVSPSQGPNLAGAGGLATTLGGQASSLEAGPVAAVGRRAASAAAPEHGIAAPPGPVDFGNGSTPVALPPGLVPRGHGSEAGGQPLVGHLPGATDAAPGGGFARASGASTLPGTAAAPLDLQPILSAARPEPVAQPEATLGRTPAQQAMTDREVADLRPLGGSRAPATPGDLDPAELDNRPDPPAAQASRAAGREEVDLNALPGGGLGLTPVAHRGEFPTLEGTVKEPTDFYRRRAAVRHALGLAEGAGFTEPAVELGLAFFTRVQFPDGHWSLDRLPEGVPTENAALGAIEADTAATGLVLLSYLGAGYTHLDEKYRDVVRRGVQWLVKHQKPDGDLFTGGHRVTHFYSQGIGTMALCEAYGMTQDPELREPAKRAIAYTVGTQDPQHGGWRYQSGLESDTSVTGWQLMALKSAQMAGLEVPERAFDGVRRWLNQAEAPERDGRYMYSPWQGDSPEERAGRTPSLAMTAEAMLMRMYLGQRRDDAQLIRGAEYLAAHLPEVGTRDHSTRDCYYWYYATQAMYQMQGPYWTAWQERLSPLLKAGQVQDGPLAGSWHPLEPVKDVYGNAGRIYVTAMNLLMLEVYYRHLPLFQELGR